MGHRDDPRVLRFVDAARRFAALVEDHKIRGKELVRAALHPLADLYAAGSALEGIRFEELPERGDSLIGMSPDEWKALYHQVCDRFGPDAGYWMTYDPTKPDPNDEKPVAGSLGDDFADIYRDVVPNLKVWDSGDESLTVEVLLDWRMAFSSHWGDHALDALKVLHRLEMEAGWGGPLRDCSDQESGGRT